MSCIKKKLLSASLCILLPTTVSGESEDGGVGIKQLMTPEQFRRTGLYKLTDEEREALDKWLHMHVENPERSPLAVPAGPESATAAPNSAGAEPEIAEQPASIAAEENFGFPDPPVRSKPEELHATVLEPFQGWSGKTIFYLDNGQVWKQRSSGHHTYTGDDNQVIISKNAMGFYEMRLLAADRSVGVNRVK